MLKKIIQKLLLGPVNGVYKEEEQRAKCQVKKLCAKCQIEKPANQYYKASNAYGGLQSYCKPCSNSSKQNQKRARSKRNRYKVPRMFNGTAEKQRVRLNIDVSGKQRVAIHELCIEKKMNLEKCCNLMVEQFLTLNGKEAK
jgi:hypothetical protein